MVQGTCFAKPVMSELTADSLFIDVYLAVTSAPGSVHDIGQLVVYLERTRTSVSLSINR